MGFLGNLDVTACKLVQTTQYSRAVEREAFFFILDITCRLLQQDPSNRAPSYTHPKAPNAHAAQVPGRSRAGSAHAVAGLQVVGFLKGSGFQHRSNNRLIVLSQKEIIHSTHLGLGSRCIVYHVAFQSSRGWVASHPYQPQGFRAGSHASHLEIVVLEVKSELGC